MIDSCVIGDLGKRAELTDSIIFFTSTCSLLVFLSGFGGEGTESNLRAAKNQAESVEKCVVTMFSRMERKDFIDYVLKEVLPLIS